MKNGKLKYSKKTLLGVGLVAMLVIGFTSATVLNLMSTEDLTPQEALEHIAGWNLATATNITVANTDTGIQNVGTYVHQISPYTLYDDGLTESNFYEHMDGTPACGEELEGETPHSTLFDYVVIIQWGYAEAYNTSSSAWEKDLVKVYINLSSTDAEIDAIASEVMLEGNFYDIDGTNDALMNVYVVGTGGFDLGQNVKYTIDDIKLYYWG